MTGILLTGGTGKTGRRIASQLAAACAAARVAARHPPPGGVRFDWADPATFDLALSGTSSIYLVAPPGAVEPLAAMEPFLRRALSAGVRRYVLLSSSFLPEGGPLMGQVHAFLRDTAPEWTVLRPSWFMQTMDTAIAGGAENRVSPDVEAVTGRAPISFEAFAAENRAAWEHS